jgi:hypothetical protein
VSNIKHALELLPEHAVLLLHSTAVGWFVTLLLIDVVHAG